MKVRSFIKFLLEHFDEDDSIEVNHCCDGGAFITDQTGSDDTLICYLSLMMKTTFITVI